MTGLKSTVCRITVMNAVLLVAGMALIACGDTEEEVPTEPVGSASPSGAASEPPAVPDQSSTLGPTPSVPADWKLYTDPVLGFSFRYPPDLVLETPPANDAERRGDEYYLRFSSPDEPQRILLVGLIVDTAHLHLDEWVAGATACVQDTVRETMIAGEPAFECTSLPEMIPESAVIFEHQGVIYFITSTLPTREFEAAIASLYLT